MCRWVCYCEWVLVRSMHTFFVCLAIMYCVYYFSGYNDHHIFQCMHILRFCCIQIARLGSFVCLKLTSLSFIMMNSSAIIASFFSLFLFFTYPSSNISLLDMSKIFFNTLLFIGIFNTFRNCNFQTSYCKK